jgi:hypothetical protein
MKTPPTEKHKEGSVLMLDATIHTCDLLIPQYQPVFLIALTLSIPSRRHEEGWRCI